MLTNQHPRICGQIFELFEIQIFGNVLSLNFPSCGFYVYVSFQDLKLMFAFNVEKTFDFLKNI